MSPIKFGSFMEQLHDLIKLKLPGMGPKIEGLIVPILMYADDVTAFATSSEDMANLIKIIELFCRLFGMKLNASKTYAVIFNNSKKSRKTHTQLAEHCHWKIGEHTIAIEHQSKFLGIIFHESKGCAVAPDDLAAKGRKALHLMMSRMKRHFINQSSFLCRMFDQLVEPVLSYGCQIWGPDMFHNKLDSSHIISRSKNPLEGVHIDFMRYLGGLPRSSPLWILYNEFQREPLQFHWLALCARFWTNATSHDDANNNVLLRACMRDNVALMLSGCTDCWVANFMKSMVTIGVLTDASLSSCHYVDACTSLPISEDIVKEQLKSRWLSVCDEMLGAGADPRSVSDDTPITHTRYRSWIIANHPIPPHLDAFIPTNLKHIIIRMRCTSFPLRIQAGRQGKNRIPRSHRLCQVCNEGCVEDEKHFLLECPVYTHLRQEYPSIFHDEASVVSILNFPNQGLLGKVIASMLELRKSTI